MTRGAMTVRWARTDTYAVQRLAVSGLAIACGLGMLGCAILAGAHIAAWGWGLGVLAAVCLGATDARLQAAAWSVLIGGWVVAVPSGFSWWALAAAVSALVAHTTTVLTAGFPRQLVWPRATLLRHLRRVLVVAAATGLVALAAWAVAQRRPGGAVLIALPALLVVAGWTWLVRDQSASSSADSGRHS